MLLCYKRLYTYQTFLSIAARVKNSSLEKYKYKEFYFTWRVTWWPQIIKFSIYHGIPAEARMSPQISNEERMIWESTPFLMKVGVSLHVYSFSMLASSLKDVRLISRNTNSKGWLRNKDHDLDHVTWGHWEHRTFASRLTRGCWFVLFHRHQVQRCTLQNFHRCRKWKKIIQYPR